MSQLSPEEKELVLKKHAQALKLRAEFQKQITNPHIHGTGQGGTVFDAGVQRFQSMRVNNFEHFKPTGKAFRGGALTVVIPIVLYAWGLKTERDGREHKYRTGQVAYKDRSFKFI